MSAFEVRASLDRLRTRAPATVTAGARLVTRSALHNARRSISQISRAVDERRGLVEALDTAQDPGDLARLSASECHELLLSQTVGRLAYVARAGVPDIVPVNYVMDGDAIVIRSAPGPKLQAAERQELVAFEVDQIDEATHTGWSVVVIGTSRRVRVSEGPSPVEPAPWANGIRRHTIRIEPQRIDGRRLL